MPRISVVVPIYNVGEYLPACLESLAQQTFRDLEVVMVDDGSTDSSPLIAAGFAERDDRFRLVRQANGGLGHARNTGVTHAGGEFLTFVDSDDIIPRAAYELMVASLDETGSDFATGNVHRLSSSGTRQSPMFAAAFTTTRRRTHVSKFPALLNDRIAPNKLWRRSFWDQHEFRFPEGVVHEDIQVAVPAHVLATSVDVIHEPVYLWRVREGEGLSITQRRTEIKAIKDRFHAVDTVSRFLAARGETELKRKYDEGCAAQDFRYSLQRLDEADDVFRGLFLDLVNDFFDRAHARVFEPLRAIDRLKYHLVRRRLMPELLEVLQFDKTGEANRRRVVSRRRTYYGEYPFRTDSRLRIPRSVYRLDRELNLRGQVDDVWWDGDTLHIEGFAHVGLVDAPERGSTRIRLTLEERGGGRRVLDLPVEQVHRPDVTAADPNGTYCYDWSGFRTSVPAGLLRAGRRRNTVWRLRAEVTTAKVMRARWLTTTAPGRAQRPEWRDLGGTRVMPTSEAGTFEIEVDTVLARTSVCRLDGETLELEGTVTGRDTDPGTAELQVTREPLSTRLSYPVACSPPADGSSTFVTRLPLGDLVRALEVGDEASHAESQGDGVVWRLALLPRAGADAVRLVAEPDLQEDRCPVQGREVVLHRTRQGALDLVERDVRPEVTDVRWDGDHLTLDGRFPVPGATSYALVISAQGRQEEHTFRLARDGGRFTTSLSPAGVTTLAGTLPLAEGVWDVLVRPAGGQGPTAHVKLSRGLMSAMPVARTVGTKQFSVRDHSYDDLVLDVGPDLLPDERGAANQSRLQTVDFPAFLRQPLKAAVLFESYGGRQYADSPRAIAEELIRQGRDLELHWAVSDGQTDLPDGLVPVRRWSREWYEAIARSRYVVTCVYRPLQSWMASKSDQVVTQTWHGPPFKKIGFDSERIGRLAGRDYHERLQRETSGWDYLISPSPVATPILRKAFRYDGEMLETGYPRTDVFFREDRDVLAARVRERLGLPEGKTVVLYAPTFRDDQHYRRNQFRLDLRLDLDRARSALGDNHVLLVRRHTKVVDNLLASGDGFVRDVSLYPDVNELLLATDVLVTDYSSLMFDFANTGRPMVFFTYDLDDYRDRLRGFYFDVERAPGPLLRTSDEVVDAVADAGAARAAHDATYREFTRDFCAFDDGHAAERVVNRVFGRP